MEVDKIIVLMCLLTEGLPGEIGRDTSKWANETIGSTHVFDFYGRLDNTTERHFGDEFFREAIRCKWTKVLLLTNGINARLGRLVLELFSIHAINVVHYEISKETKDGFQETFWHIYNQKHITNIVWIGKLPDLLLTVLKNLFDRECRGFGALMPHDLQIVLVVETNDIKILEKVLEDSVFDNVAVFTIREDVLTVENVYTLMWRQRRHRQLELVIPSDAVIDDNKCIIFPNIDLGMNERILTGIAKAAVPFLHISQNGSYNGFVIYIINTLASHLNFTYVLEPNPKHKLNMTWEHFRKVLSEAKVDFGAAVVAVNYVHNWNFSVTHPVLFGNISGVYVQRKTNRLQKLGIFLIDEVHLACWGCILFMVLIYALMQRMIIKEKKQDKLQNQVVQVTHDEKISTENDDKHQSCESSTGFIELFFRFFGSMLNQEDRLFPTHFPLRILIWSWRLFVFIITTVVTSNITAYLIDSSENSLTVSMKELITRGEYMLGLDVETSYDILMADPRQMVTTKQSFFSRGVLSNGHDYLTTRDVISKLDSGNYVALVFSPVVEMWYRKHLQNLARLPETVMMANLGIPLPENSTIEKVFSDAIIKFTECGLLRNSGRMFKWDADVTESEARDKTHLGVDVHTFLDYMIFCYYLLGISTFTLIGECLFVKIRSRIQKFINKRNNETVSE